MRIEQVYFSNSVKFFEAEFLKRWNISRYYDIDKPALFFGVYGIDDVNAINKHKGFKLVWNSGQTRDCFKFINPNNLIVWVGNGVPFENNCYKTRDINIEIKDFSMFKPNPLGNKIYWYMGTPAAQGRYHYKVYEELAKRCDHEIVLGYLGHDINWIKENYYDKCFVNIKPAIVQGYTTSTELAFMGRYSIGRGINSWNKNFETVDDMLRLIDIEAKKIGTVQPSLIGDYFTKKDWQNVGFWL